MPTASLRGIRFLSSGSSMSELRGFQGNMTHNSNTNMHVAVKVRQVETVPRHHVLAPAMQCDVRKLRAINIWV